MPRSKRAIVVAVGRERVLAQLDQHRHVLGQVLRVLERDLAAPVAEHDVGRRGVPVRVGGERGHVADPVGEGDGVLRVVHVRADADVVEEVQPVADLVAAGRRVRPAP